MSSFAWAGAATVRLRHDVAQMVTPAKIKIEPHIAKAGESIFSPSK